MRIIGCDLHAAQQTIAMLDRETGEIVERKLTHDGTTVRDFYASLPPPVVVGIEATGSMGWFLRLMEELAITCQVGDPAKIRQGETRRQKHDRRDARLLLDLLSGDRFPSIWMSPRKPWTGRSPEQGQDKRRMASHAADGRPDIQTASSRGVATRSRSARAGRAHRGLRGDASSRLGGGGSLVGRLGRLRHRACQDSRLRVREHVERLDVGWRETSAIERGVRYNCFHETSLSRGSLAAYEEKAVCA